jgi:hypothetical protein
VGPAGACFTKEFTITIKSYDDYPIIVLKRIGTDIFKFIANSNKMINFEKNYN